MQKYKNLSGKSGIIGFEETGDSITIFFSKGGVYLYNYKRPGIQITEKMKKIANEGKGLNTYINQFVKSNYYERIR
jgi:hypothetical protein